jgi:NAD(P)-dependent dehydrogenase (short-subunit alcohol dehydrogenase family)
MSQPIHRTAPDDRRTVLVTGTSSGIGLATAVALAGAGWTTVATLRDPSRAAALRAAADGAGVELDVRQLDVTDPASVTACLDAVVAEHGALDAVVNNAGAAHVGTVETDDLQAFRDCLEVNFFGVVQVTRAAMPHLRASGGRLVTVSSVGGVVGQPFNEAYCAAKFAVEGFCEALAPVAAAVGVRVSVVEPGAVASEFITNAGLDPAELVAGAGPYQAVVERYLDRTMRQFGTAAQPANEVADVLVGLLDRTDPPFRVQTSHGSRAFVATKFADTDGSAVLALTGGWLR